MDISKFLIILIVFTLGFLLVEQKKIEFSPQLEEKAQVTFTNSMMYEISATKVHQIIKSKQADIYKNREELRDAVMIVKSDKNSEETSTVSGQKIIKKKNKVSLAGDVSLQLSNGIAIETEQLEYDLKTRIARNSVDFQATRATERFSGNSLYLDSIKNHIVAQQAKFRMRVENE